MLEIYLSLVSLKITHFSSGLRPDIAYASAAADRITDDIFDLFETLGFFLCTTGVPNIVACILLITILL